MFSMRFLAPPESRGVSCVKLPAAAAFPTDSRLLQRIEESRRALPANNVKPLWRIRDRAQSVSRERGVEKSSDHRHVAHEGRGASPAHSQLAAARARRGQRFGGVIVKTPPSTSLRSLA